MSAEIVCTLEGASFAERVIWIRALFARSLLERREEGLALHLALAPEAADDVDDLVRRERACCAFLEFEVERSADAVRLTIKAPEAARDSAGLMFAAFDRD